MGFNSTTSIIAQNAHFVLDANEKKKEKWMGTLQLFDANVASKYMIILHELGFSSSTNHFCFCFCFGKYFPHYQVSRSLYIPANNSVTCVQKFFFICFDKLFFHMCQTVIYKKDEYLFTDQKASSILLFLLE